MNPVDVSDPWVKPDQHEGDEAVSQVGNDFELLSNSLNFSQMTKRTKAVSKFQSRYQKRPSIMSLQSRSATIKRSQTRNVKQETYYNYRNLDLDNILFEQRLDINCNPIILRSMNRQAILNLSTPKKQVTEFLKALSTAHECMIDVSSMKS